MHEHTINNAHQTAWKVQYAAPQHTAPSQTTMYTTKALRHTAQYQVQHTTPQYSTLYHSTLRAPSVVIGLSVSIVMASECARRVGMRTDVQLQRSYGRSGEATFTNQEQEQSARRRERSTAFRAAGGFESLVGRANQIKTTGKHYLSSIRRQQRRSEEKRYTSETPKLLQFLVQTLSIFLGVCVLKASGSNGTDTSTTKQQVKSVVLQEATAKPLC